MSPKKKTTKKKTTKRKSRAETIEESTGGGLSELVKKFVASPDQALQKISSTTNELRSALGTEMKKYLDKIDLSREIERILEKYDFEVQATIRLKKKKSASKSKK